MEVKVSSPILKVVFALLRWCVIIFGLLSVLSCFWLMSLYGSGFAILQLFFIALSLGAVFSEIAFRKPSRYEYRVVSRTLYAFSIVIFVVMALASGIQSPSHSQPSVGMAGSKHQLATVHELHTLVNDERSKAGVSALILDDRLNSSAQSKADDMVVNNYFDHVSPQTGKQGYEGIESIMPGHCWYISENLAADAFTSAEILQSWNGSTSHHAAILDPKYNLVGYGINQNKIVQHFCALN